MDQVRIRFAFLRSDETGVIRLELDDKYLNLLRVYAQEHKETLGDSMAVIEPWNFDYSEEAFKFFHKVRDLIVERQSGPLGDRASEKTRVKKQLKAEFGSMEGGYTKSTKDYDREEMWKLCRGAVDWLYEAGGDLGGLRIDFEMLEEKHG